MQKGRTTHRTLKWWHFAVAAMCVLPVVAIIPGCGGSSGSDTISASPFIGNYSGNYTGSESGTFTYTIGSDGTIVAAITSPSVGTVAAAGGIDQNGNFSFSGTSNNGQTTFTFGGSVRQINNVFSASGTWQTNRGGSGTFTAQEAPRGTPTPGSTARPTSTPTRTPAG